MAKCVVYYLDASYRAEFIINPTAVSIEPVHRVDYVQTFGGTVVAPWWNRQRYADYVHGYDRVNIVMSGVWNVYHYKGEEQGFGGREKGIVEGILEKLGVGVRKDRYWLGIKDKGKVASRLEEIKAEKKELGKMRDGLLDLFLTINNSFVVADDTGYRKAKWYLDLSTVVFGKKGQLKHGISQIEVIPVAPMTISERAENPFLPTWSVRFGVFNEAIKRLRDALSGTIKTT